MPGGALSPLPPLPLQGPASSEGTRCHQHPPTLSPVPPQPSQLNKVFVTAGVAPCLSLQGHRGGMGTPKGTCPWGTRDCGNSGRTTGWGTGWHLPMSLCPHGAGTGPAAAPRRGYKRPQGPAVPAPPWHCHRHRHPHGPCSSPCSVPPQVGPPQSWGLSPKLGAPPKAGCSPPQTYGGVGGPSSELGLG